MDLLVYRPESSRDLSEWVYLHCLKILAKKSLIMKIFDDTIANQDYMFAL